MLRILSGILVFCLCSNSFAFTGAPSLTMEAARQEAGRNAAGAAKIDMAKSDSGKTFDGITIKLLSPVGYVDVNGSQFDGVPKEKAPLEKIPLAGEKAGRARGGDDEIGDTYHFKAKTPLQGLTIYTTEKDKPGQDNSTEKPKTGGWRKWLKPALLVGGILAVIAGFFFPPLLFLGGFLLGAAATHHLLGAAD